MKSKWMTFLIIVGFISPAGIAETWSFREGRGVSLGEKSREALRITTDEVSEVVEISEDALVETIRGDFVYTKNGTAYLRVPVVTGERRDGRVIVLEGLFDGDQVVNVGAYDLWMIELQAVNSGRGCADGH